MSSDLALDDDTIEPERTLRPGENGTLAQEIVPATVAIAIAAPIQGSERETRRESRAPAQLAIRFVIVIKLPVQCAFRRPRAQA